MNVLIKLHCGIKMWNGNVLMKNHTKLNMSNVQDLLCLAALRCTINLSFKLKMNIKIQQNSTRNNYKIYDALNIYLSMCNIKKNFMTLH